MTQTQTVNFSVIQSIHFINLLDLESIKVKKQRKRVNNIKFSGIIKTHILVLIKHCFEEIKAKYKDVRILEDIEEIVMFSVWALIKNFINEPSNGTNLLCTEKQDKLKKIILGEVQRVNASTWKIGIIIHHDDSRKIEGKRSERLSKKRRQMFIEEVCGDMAGTPDAVGLVVKKLKTMRMNEKKKETEKPRKTNKSSSKHQKKFDEAFVENWDRLKGKIHVYGENEGEQVGRDRFSNLASRLALESKTFTLVGSLSSNNKKKGFTD